MPPRSRTDTQAWSTKRWARSTASAAPVRSDAGGVVTWSDPNGSAKCPTSDRECESGAAADHRHQRWEHHRVVAWVHAGERLQVAGDGTGSDARGRLSPGVNDLEPGAAHEP